MTAGALVPAGIYMATMVQELQLSASIYLTFMITGAGCLFTGQIPRSTHLGPRSVASRPEAVMLVYVNYVQHLRALHVTVRDVRTVHPSAA